MPQVVDLVEDDGSDLGEGQGVTGLHEVPGILLQMKENKGWLRPVSRSWVLWFEFGVKLRNILILFGRDTINYLEMKNICWWSKNRLVHLDFLMLFKHNVNQLVYTK